MPDNQGGEQQGGGQQQQQQQQGGQQQQQAPWHGQTDPDAVAYIGNKGWKDVNGLLGSYRAAEKMIGRDPETILARPADGDEAGWAKFYDKVGRPASPDKYDLRGGLPEGAQIDDAFMKNMATMFHKHGLTAAQAAGIAKEFNASQIAAAQQADNDARTSLSTDKADLLKAWGGGYERMMNSAQTAVAALGFTKAEVDAIEGVIGYKGVMEKFAALGQKLTDPSFVTADGGARFGDTQTPAEAKAEIEKLKMDPGFKAALHGGPMHPGKKAASEKWTKLHQVAYGSEPLR
jgi:hypothetical protein